MKIIYLYLALLLFYACANTTSTSNNTPPNIICEETNMEEEEENVIGRYFDTAIIAVEEIIIDSTIGAQLETSLKINTDLPKENYEVGGYVEAINLQVYCVMFSATDDDNDLVESCENNFCERLQSYLFFYGQKIYFSTFADDDFYCMNWMTIPSYPKKITLCNQKQYIIWSFIRLYYSESRYPRKDIIISLDSQKIDVSKEIYSYPLEY